MEQNKYRELEVLEAELNNARLAQKCRAGQAHMREAKLERYQGIVQELQQTVDSIDDEALEHIVNSIRAKLNQLNI